MTWSSVILSEVAELEREGVQPEDIEEGATYLGLEHVASGGEILAGGAVGAGELKSTKFRFTSAHVLYGKLRPYLAKIALPNNSGVCTTEIIPIRPGPRLDRRYLAYFLRQPEQVERATSLSAGANLPRLGPNALAQFPILLPPLSEQRRIAAILDEADALRTKRRAALAQLDEIARAIFMEMFGDPLENLMGWNRMALENVLIDIESGWSPTCLDRPAGQDEWGVLKLGAVTRCTFDAAQNKGLPSDIKPNPELEVKSGDLLFTRKNTYELVAACALVGKTRPLLMFSDLIFRLRLKKDAPVNSAFLHGLLTYPTQRRAVQSLAGGSSGSMPNISKGRLRQLKVVVPSIDRQNVFAAELDKIEQLRNSFVKTQPTTASLFQSLQHRAFRGEL